MTQVVLYFLTTSLLMGLIIGAFLALRMAFPKALSPKLRYLAWVIILIALVIPVRPLFGEGLVSIPVQTQQLATSQAPVALPDEGSAAVDQQALAVQESAGFSLSVAGQSLGAVEILVILWAVVAVAILAYHGWRHASFVKLTKRWGNPVTDEDVLAVLRTVQAESGISRPIELRKCEFISTSMIVGLFRPMILLPEKDFDADELDLIFRHELIHYKRGDLFVKLLSIIAVSLNWFNPAVYVMNKAMQADCEASCDEAVIVDVGKENRQFYAETIMEMIGHRGNSSTAFSTCFYGSKSGIKSRMESIMNAPWGTKRVTFSALFVLVAAVILSGSIVVFSGYGQPEVVATDEPAQVVTPDDGVVSSGESVEPYDIPDVDAGADSGNDVDAGQAQQNDISDSSAVSMEDAIAIAYADLSRRGISASLQSTSGMSWEYGQYVWELLFRTQGERMPFIEYYISVDNGTIVKFEWDD